MSNALCFGARRAAIRTVKLSALTILVNWPSPAFAQQAEDPTELTAPAPEEGDLFGCAVALNQDLILVGSLLDDSLEEDSGAAYLFDRPGGTPSMTTLCPGEIRAGAQFGYSVALSDSLAVVGAPFHDAGGPGAGAVYVFDLGGTGCLASDPLLLSVSRQDQAGFSVAIEGETLAVGAPGVDGRGAVHILKHNGSDWVPHLPPLTVGDGRPGDGFGFSVALGGSLLIVGAPFADGAGRDSGRAYVFEEQDGSWLEPLELRADDVASGDRFGFSVAIDGETVVVGAPRKGPGAVYVFTADRGDEREIFEWVQRRRLPTDSSPGAELGVSVAIAAGSDGGKRILVGARSDDSFGPNAGAAFIFRGRGAQWNVEPPLDAGSPGDELGLGAAIDGDLAVVGAFKHDVIANGESVEDAGAAYMYPITGQPAIRLDWGDAPNSYDTRRARDGARHVIPQDPVLFLGDQAPDAEENGQPDPNAVGDDQDGDVDDEDGVKFPNRLVPGGRATVEITSRAEGILNAWIDFDRGGSWNSDDEHVFRDRMISGTEPLSFDVPLSATPGPTFARFRIASESELKPTGEAADGEVEDYRIMISKQPSGPDLEGSISDGDVTAIPGDVIRYTIEVENVGGLDATRVMINETVPENTTFDLDSSSEGWSCTAGAPAGSPCTLELGDDLSGVPDGEAVSVVFAVKVNEPIPANVDDIANQATVTASNADPATVSETTPIEADADLKITVRDGDAAAKPGEMIHYNIEVDNVGNRTAEGVIISETVPENTTFFSVKTSRGWSCVGRSAGSRCSYRVEGGLVGAPDGEAVTVDFTVFVDDTVPADLGAIDNTASVMALNVASAETDISTSVIAAPILGISKSDRGNDVRIGETIDYDISYSNTGDQDASGVVIHEVVPRDTRFDEGRSSAAWSCSDDAPPGSTCTFIVGSLPAGSKGEAFFSLVVDADAEGAAIANEAIIEADNADTATDTDLTHIVGGAPPTPPVLFDKLFLSVDGGGSAGPSYEVEVQKPNAQATVRLAILLAATTKGSCLPPQPISPPGDCQLISDDEIRLDGQPVSWDVSLFPNHIFGSSQSANVTSIVRAKVNEKPPGRIRFGVEEIFSDHVDGVALAVVFNDPTQSERSSVSLNLIIPNPSEEIYVITLDKSSVNVTSPEDAVLGLGISSGAFGMGSQGEPSRSTRILINTPGQPLTNLAGGTNDGADEDGARITVGGFDDRFSNIGNEGCNDDSNDQDCELYSLQPFIEPETERLTIELTNPGRKENNVFLLYFQAKAVAAFGRGILLTPGSRVLPVGSSNMVTAKLVKDNGEPEPDAMIEFEVVYGPNSGEDGIGFTDEDGEVVFAYIGDGGAGTDRIRATLVPMEGEPPLVSNDAFCDWE